MSAGATEAARVRAERVARLAGLYAITPEVDDTHGLCEQVTAALRGGASAIQYRAKTLGAARRREQAQALATLCREHRALFIVNDDADLAAAVQADGVHLGRDDGDPAAARDRVGERAIVGVSCYDDLARARRLAGEGADYLAFGSLFPSSVKPQAVRASLDLVRSAAALDLPVVGIGGIDAGNAGAVIAAGARAVAVITAVFGASDIEAAARRLARACAEAAGSASPSTLSTAAP